MARRYRTDTPAVATEECFPSPNTTGRRGGDPYPMLNAILRKGLVDLDTCYLDSTQIRASRAAAGAKKGGSKP